MTYSFLLFFNSNKEFTYEKIEFPKTFEVISVT